MSTMKATVRDRRIELTAPDDLPDGTEVLVEVTPVSPGKIGLAASEWREAAALADGEAWLATIEPIELTPADQAAGGPFPLLD